MDGYKARALVVSSGSFWLLDWWEGVCQPPNSSSSLPRAWGSGNAEKKRLGPQSRRLLDSSLACTSSTRFGFRPTSNSTHTTMSGQAGKHFVFHFDLKSWLDAKVIAPLSTNTIAQIDLIFFFFFFQVSFACCNMGNNHVAMHSCCAYPAIMTFHILFRVPLTRF